MNVNDISLGGRLMVLMVGPNGKGKSCAAATFPGPIKFFDFDGRMKPVKLLFPTRRDIEYDTYGPKPVPRAGIKSYVDFCEEFEDLQDSCPWGTVVIDSLTALSNTSITYQLQVKSGNDTLAKSMKKTKGGLVTATFDEFNGETTTITQILDVAKMLPCHVIMTAHPVTKTEIKGEGQPAIKSQSLVAYGPKVASFIPIYFDEIWQFTSKVGGDGGRLYQVQTQPITNDDMAKSALPLETFIDITRPKKLFAQVQEQLAAYDIRLTEAIARKRAELEAAKINDQQPF